MKKEFGRFNLTVVFFKNIWLGGRKGAKFSIGLMPRMNTTFHRYGVSFYLGYYVLAIDFYQTPLYWLRKRKEKYNRLHNAE